MANKILPPVGYYPDPEKGKPIAGGTLYIGEPDLDPEVFPKQVTILQEDGTQVPVIAPIELSSGGVPIYDGSTSISIFVDGDYSWKVLDKFGAQKYYVPDSSISVDILTDEKFFFDNVAELAAQSLDSGTLAETAGYDSAGDGLGGNYFVKTPGEYGGDVAGTGDIVIANGNIAVLQDVDSFLQHIGNLSKVASNPLLGGALNPIAASFESGKELVVIFRSAETHDDFDGASALITRSNDYGKTWSTPTTLVSIANTDVRQYGGGNTTEPDTMIFFFSRKGTLNADVQFIRSIDKGVSWSSPTTLSLPAVIGNGNAYGKLAIFGTKLIQPLYGGDHTAIAVSIDDGASWSTFLQFAPTDSPVSGSVLTEMALVAINDTEGVGIIRDDGGVGRNALHYYTNDGGTSWSTLTETSIRLDKQPPTLISKNDYVNLLWPNRPQDGTRFYTIGEFTPEAIGTTTSGTHVYTRQIGKFVQIGSIRHCFLEIIISASDWDPLSSGELRVSTGMTLPDAEYGQIAVSIGQLQTLGDGPSPTDYMDVVGFFGAGSNIMRLNVNRLTSSSQPLLADDVINFSFIAQFTYPVELPRGDLNNPRQWLASRIDHDLYNDGDAFSSEFGLPIQLPFLGGGVKGDSGYGVFVKMLERDVMFHYLGTYRDYGCDVVFSNMENIL